MKNYFFILFLLLNIVSTDASIVEHVTLDAVFNYIDMPNTLVIFDIDNTLVTSPLLIGTDEWFSHLVAQKQRNGMGLEQAINSTLPTSFHVASYITLIPVESTTSAVIKKLEAQNIPTLGLTSRSIYIADRTLEQLAHLDINLSIPQAYIDEFYITMPTHIPSMYKSGLLFSGNNDKGEVLLEFFKETGYYPSKIVFVDDKEKYLLSVQAAAAKKSIPFVGIRYGGCDERVKNFDSAQADREFAEFKAGRFVQKKSSSWFSYLYDLLYSSIKYLLPA